ncbi:hypothetical protein OA493_00485 [Gammaproteobacteria bacterium]|nr:hypothetical protein [Gammaproteobacteria bacterium]|tara:strand:+ start:1448 stop:1612 length:165 start_codon:yes stop_codon:yes gene_type:complete
MKLLNDLFSLISGTGKKDNLKDMIEDNPLRLVIALVSLLVVFVSLVSVIVMSII